MKPLRPRMGRRTTLAIAAFIWLLGSVLSLPMLVFFTTYEINLADGSTRVICYSEWPDGATNLSFLEYL
ncbi:hypothetical protein B566_EDAN006324 [Ephemera danica]|nr:hypothetical protein B566_EDAN006324 [Ephemera danica]